MYCVYQVVWEDSMEVVSYICKGIHYTVLPITDTAGIDSDIATIITEIDNVDMEEYKANMIESVAQGLAYAVYRGEDRVGFVYNKVNGNRYLGCSIHIWDHVAMLIAMKTMFEIHNSHKIEFSPHSKNMKYFMSLLYAPSVRKHYVDGSPLVVLRDPLVSKGKDLFKYYSIELA